MYGDFHTSDKFLKGFLPYESMLISHTARVCLDRRRPEGFGGTHLLTQHIMRGLGVHVNIRLNTR